MRWFEQLWRSWTLGKYARVAGKLLVRRYGHAEHYTSGRVKVTLERAGMSLRYLPHACAMFCSRDEFLTWMESREKAPHRLRLGDPYRSRLRRTEATPAHRRHLELYEELRREAARENGGSLRFLPAAPPAPITWTPVSNDIATGMKVPF